MYDTDLLSVISLNRFPIRNFFRYSRVSLFSIREVLERNDATGRPYCGGVPATAYPEASVSTINSSFTTIECSAERKFILLKFSKSFLRSCS